MPPPPQPPANTLLALLPIIFSAIAIFVSLSSAVFATYLQYFRRPKVSILISRNLNCWIGGRDDLIFNVGVTCTNSGARYAVITSITGVLLENHGNTRIEFVWSKFITYENTAPKGERFQPHGSFAGWTEYLIVPNRQAVANSIQFGSIKPFPGRPGTYRLKFTACAGSGSKTEVLAAAEVEFEIPETKAEKLMGARADEETKVAKSSVSFITNHV